MPVPGRRRLAGRAERPSRAGLVDIQYEDPAAAAEYAASHDGWGPAARFFHSRFHAVERSLRACPGGDLLDAGCGPGMLVRHMLDTRPGDFRITACDLSHAMVDAAAERTAGLADVNLRVACIEDMPFDDGSFDVAVATGVLEYAEVDRALRELARVVRPGGLVVVTMLNMLSPYRLFEWVVYWPTLRLLGRVEQVLAVPPERRHGAQVSGIRAVAKARLLRMMRDAGLAPQDVVYFDLTPLVPPFDRMVRQWSRRWRDHPERTVSRGVRRWMGTAYLVAARRTRSGGT